MDKQLASLFRFLIDALKDEIENHARLLDVIREETQALRESRLSEVLDIGIKKGAAFRQSEGSMRRRMDAAKNIAACLHLEDSLPSFVELASYADDTTRKILTGYRDKFADIVRGIKSANETNRQTIALTLAHISNIDFMMNIAASLPNYDRYGQVSARSLQSEFISQTG